MDEKPIKGNVLILDPLLAQVIGLNKAIVLRQIHYWLDVNTKGNKHLHDGRYWTYNSYDNWQKQFPFWSISTIKRTLLELERDGILISANYNKINIDKTKWYTIDYDRVKMIHPLGQNDTLDCIKLTRPIPEINSPEIIATEKIRDNGSFQANVQANVSTCHWDKDIRHFIEHYKNKLYPHYKKKKHPNLKIEQLKRIHDTLLLFVNNKNLTLEELNEMAKSFFEKVQSNDHNINHFATEGILDIRFYDSGIY